MSESDMKERSSLRGRVTKKVNVLTGNLENLPREELEAEMTMLKDYHDDLKIMDNKILSKSIADSSVTTEELQKMQEVCDGYLKKT